MQDESKRLAFPLINISALEPLKGKTADLHTRQADEIADDVYYALSKFGFMYISGHGIDENIIHNAFRASKNFFLNQRSICKKYRREQGVMLGYVDGFNEVDNPKAPEDLKQGYDFVLNSPQFQTLSEDIKLSLEILYRHFEVLSRLILRLLAKSLGKSDLAYFEKAHQKMGNIGKNSTTMRILYYPVVKKKPLPEQARISEHTDFGTFTMLLQDDCGGLEVMSPNGTYESATPIKNTIIFNIGDLLQLWTNFELKSTLHRVVVTDKSIAEKRSRQSIAYFTNPDNDFSIDYEDVNGNSFSKSVQEHIDERNNNTIFNKTQS